MMENTTRLNRYLSKVPFDEPKTTTSSEDVTFFHLEGFGTVFYSLHLQCVIVLDNPKYLEKFHLIDVVRNRTITALQTWHTQGKTRQLNLLFTFPDFL